MRRDRGLVSGSDLGLIRDFTPLRLGLADTFAADDLLPGFSCKLADFFPD